MHGPTNGDKMAEIAIVETKPSRTDFYKEFDQSFEFDQFQLCSDPGIKKVLKKDVDIDFDPDAYKWVILVGSDALKFYTKMTSVTQYSGSLVDKKFLPIINPAMLKYNPAAQKSWDDSKRNVIAYINGKVEAVDFSKMVEGIQDSDRALEYVQEALDAPGEFIALDSETSALYPRDGYMLGISLTYKPEYGVYIDADVIDERVEAKLQELFEKKTVVFHNAKFDLKFFQYHFNFKFYKVHDTMLMHYMLLEDRGTHGLKYLAIKHTRYGDYEKPLEEFKDNYCRTHKIKKEDFSYAYIPFDVMYPYASMDTVATYALFVLFSEALMKNKKIKRAYNEIMMKGCRFLVDVEEAGIPFDRERAIRAEKFMDDEIDMYLDKLYQHQEVRRFEEDKAATIKDGRFNPNSVVQLRSLLFDYAGLSPTGKMTDAGQHSTDEEVLKELSHEHELPDLILNIRKKNKIKNTYLSKIIPQIDADGRLRTNINQHMTTSGRLSSSGKINAQQFPRDDPIVKGCIVAKEGYKIISMDLTTAEMYYAASYSKDPVLSEIFRKGENLHSSVAKEIFGLDCEIADVAKYYAKERQATKAINFGIIYGAGGYTISRSIKKDTGILISVEECNEYIDMYFRKFKKLKDWLDETRQFIETNGFIYSHFGRKRRLPNVMSNNSGISGHEVRSGLNFMIQSVASDVNLLAGIEMNNWIKETSMNAKIFCLVHDSILAEVEDSVVDDYNDALRGFVQKDRGISIPGAPINCDFEIGQDYSFGKFEERYPKLV